MWLHLDLSPMFVTTTIIQSTDETTAGKMVIETNSKLTDGGSVQPGTVMNYRQRMLKAGERTRTADIHVGNVTLYQLSYTRDAAPDYTPIIRRFKQSYTSDVEPPSVGRVCITPLCAWL